MAYRVRSASHIGRQHLLAYRNNQDALSVFTLGDELVAGIICDGCSEGPFSEVGARMASQFLIRETHRLLQHGVDTTAIPGLLYDALISFVRASIAGYSFISRNDRNLFIRDHFLFTVVGFILTANNGAVFHAGDGTIVINDNVTFIDQANRPLYPSYHLVEKDALPSITSLPNGFDVIPVEVATLNRLAIGSDAWQQRPELLQRIWNYEKPIALQRQINVWSRNEKLLDDDVSIITYEVSNQGGTNDNPE